MKRQLLATAVAWIAASHSVMAADKASDEKAIRQVAKNYETLWNKHDMNAFADLFTDDAEWVNVVGMVWRGKPEVMKAQPSLPRNEFQESFDLCRRCDGSFHPARCGGGDCQVESRWLHRAGWPTLRQRN